MGDPGTRPFLARHRVAAVSAASTLAFGLLADQMGRGTLRGFDAAGTQWVTQHRGQLDAVMLGLTRFAASTPLFAATVLVVPALARRKRAREARFLALSGAGILILDQLLKRVFERARPEPPFLVALPTSFSFPSGHAMGATCIYLSLVVVLYALGVSPLLRWLAVVAALGLALGVGLSRVYLGVHYPSDVLGGYLAGLAWSAAVTSYFYPGASSRSIA